MSYHPLLLLYFGACALVIWRIAADYIIPNLSAVTQALGG